MFPVAFPEQYGFPTALPGGFPFLPGLTIDGSSPLLPAHFPN
jgi:hypothetical protein